MDENKNMIEELNNLFSSIKELVCKQFVDMQQRIELLERKVAELENTQIVENIEDDKTNSSFEIDLDFEHQEPTEEKPISPALDWYDWEVDYPGTSIDDISSGIGMNDKIVFIRELFKDDEEKYNEIIYKLNGMNSFKEAVEYMRENFPNWDEQSEEVYKFYMNVRRKLK